LKCTVILPLIYLTDLPKPSKELHFLSTPVKSPAQQKKAIVASKTAWTLTDLLSTSLQLRTEAQGTSGFTRIPQK
jgi:hypothetical protein